MPGFMRQSDLTVTIGGQNVANAAAAQVTLGYDMAFATASVTCAGTNPGGTYYDDVNIMVNGEHWFSGLLLQVDYNLYPRQVTLQCKGRLWLANQYKLAGSDIDHNEGLPLLDLLGSETGSDEQIVQAVLDRAGVSLNGGSIGGTGEQLGSVAPDQFSWRDGESALDYINRIDGISAGYRTFESTGGSIFRSNVSTVPDGGTDMTFTEGFDIAQGQGQRSVQEAFNAVRVSGYDVGDFLDPRVFYVEEGSSVLNGTRVFTFNSPMIERRADSSPGFGISCERVANYWLHELNREIIRLTMTTPRNDNIGPGQIHRINGAERLGISNDLWVQRIDKTYAASGQISQSITYIGGG